MALSRRLASLPILPNHQGSIWQLCAKETTLKCKRNQSFQNARRGKKKLYSRIKKFNIIKLQDLPCFTLTYAPSTDSSFTGPLAFICIHTEFFTKTELSRASCCSNSRDHSAQDGNAWQSLHSVQNLHFIKDSWEDPFKNTLCSVKINHFMLIIKVTTE